MDCLNCQRALTSAPRQLSGGQWIVDCEVCDVMNLLSKPPDGTEECRFCGFILDSRDD